MVAASLSPASYVFGSATVVTVVSVVSWGAFRLRCRLLPTWSGAPARLAEAVLALAATITSAQLLGSVGWLRAGPVLVTGLASGLGMVVFGTQPAQVALRRATRVRPNEVVAASIAGALLVTQWTSHVVFALRDGMTHPDTLWYHAPFAARFVQQGSFTGLEGLGYAASRHYPFNAELVHALVILPFGRDILSPLVNLGWAGLAMLAAWCVGRRRGLGLVSIVGAVAVLGLPALAGTQPGQASSDVAAAALLLSSVALLLEGELAPTPTALAGVAAGLALGTKLTVAVPVAVLSVGVVVLAARARRPVVAGLWVGALAAFGSYWFIRNWVVADNPLPWFGLHLGPLSFPATAPERGSAIVDHILDSDIWTQVYRPGLAQGLGRVWPLVLGLAFASAVLALVRGRQPIERAIGIALLAGVVGYVFSPLAGGLTFAFNLRYLGPVLLVGFAVLPLALHGGRAFWRGGLVLILVGLIAVDATAAHWERVPAWPTDTLIPAVLISVAALAGLALFARHRDAQRRLALAGLLVLAVGWVGGWWVQRQYLDRRYVDAGLHAASVNAFFREVRDADVAVFGTVEVYPMFGLDLSNRVISLEDFSGRARIDVCRELRRVLRGPRRYIVFSRFGIVGGAPPPIDDASRSISEVVREGDSVVYRLAAGADVCASA